MIRVAASTEDLTAIRRIAEDAYSPYVARLGRKPAPMVADFEKHLVDDWVVVFARDHVLGYAVVRTLGEVPQQVMLLDNIAVAIDAQRQGIGNALIEHVEQHVLAAGMKATSSTPTS
ncbi:MAG: GNAT family N-acetyltransferase [Geminicoccaceae bacterium]